MNDGIKTRPCGTVVLIIGVQVRTTLYISDFLKQFGLKKRKKRKRVGNRTAK